MRKYLLWFTFFTISCGQSKRDAQTNKSSIDSFTYHETVSSDDTLSADFLTQLVFSIEEVKQKNRYLDSLTNHKNGIIVRIIKPTVDEKCYYLQAGYDTETRFVNIFNFYIDPSTKEITIEDVIVGDRVTMEQWRKRQVAKYYK